MHSRACVQTGERMITSKVSSKSQTTIPQPVRLALGLKEGDTLVYVLSEQGVILRKSPDPVGEDDPFRTFTEWHGMADQDAYGQL